MTQRVTKSTGSSDVFPNNLSGGNQAQTRQIIRDEINQPTEAKYFAPLGRSPAKLTAGQVVYANGWDFSPNGGPGMFIYDIASLQYLPLTKGNPVVNPHLIQNNVQYSFIDYNSADARLSGTPYHGVGWVELESGVITGSGIAMWATPGTVFYGDSGKDWLIELEITMFADQDANAAGADTAYIFGFFDDVTDPYSTVRTVFYADPASLNWKLKAGGSTVDSGVAVGVGYDNRQNLRLVMRNKDGNPRTDFYINGTLVGQILSASEDVAQAFGFAIAQQSVSNNVICTVGNAGINMYFPE